MKGYGQLKERKHRPWPSGSSTWPNRAGIDAPSHAFRRGFARRMRAGGLDLGETATLMGHSTLTMTRHYSQDGETDAAISAYRKLVG